MRGFLRLNLVVRNIVIKNDFNKNEKYRVMRLLIFDMGINYTSSVLICAAPPMIRDNLVYIL